MPSLICIFIIFSVIEYCSTGNDETRLGIISSSSNENDDYYPDYYFAIRCSLQEGGLYWASSKKSVFFSRSETTWWVRKSDVYKVSKSKVKVKWFIQSTVAS